MEKGQRKVLLVNPQSKDLEKMMKKVEELDEPRKGPGPKTWLVESTSRDMAHKVTLGAISKEKAPKHAQRKCKHIIKVELATSPAEYLNSIDARDEPRQPDKVLIGKCACEAFMYGDSLRKKDGEYKEQATPMVLAEKVGQVDEVFKDLPDFGLQILWGKLYVNKEGLETGLRRKYPDASIDVEIVEWTEERARVKATVRNQEMEVSGHGTAYSDNPVTKDRHLEMAETRAINRAIRHLFGLPLTLEEVVD